MLTVAAASASALWGGLILVFFAAGMAFPLVLLSVLWKRLPVVQKVVRPRAVSFGPVTTTWTNLVGGLLMIGMAALLFFTGGTAELSGFLGAGTQARIEGWVLQKSSAGVELVILGVIAALAAVIAMVVMKRRGSRNK